MATHPKPPAGRTPAQTARDEQFNAAVTTIIDTLEQSDAELDTQQMKDANRLVATAFILHKIGMRTYKPLFAVTLTLLLNELAAIEAECPCCQADQAQQ